MKCLTIGTIRFVSLAVVTPFLTQPESATMGQDVKYPAAESLSRLDPPLIDLAAAESRYHRRLFEGKFGLPAIADIDEIKAELYQCSAYGPPLGPFKVRREYVPKVMAFFEGGIIDPTPNFIQPETGTLMISTKDGNVRRICWYGATKARLRFSLQGMRCVASQKDAEPGDEAWELDHLLREAHEQADMK